MPVVVEYSPAANVLSVTALSVMPIVLLFFRHYYRGLEFLQMCFLFAITMATTSFSSHLTIAMLDFSPTIFTSCTAGDYICSNGFTLSLGAILIGILIITFIFVALQKCCNKSIEYEPVYNVFKAFIKWIYLPLVYSTSYWVIKQFDMPSIDTNSILTPGIILAVLLIFPFFQLIGYKCIQKETDPPARKWMEWLSYTRVVSTGVLCALYTYYSQQKYLNCIIIVLSVYAFFYLIFGEYKYKVMERVIFVIGDGLFLTLYFIFQYRPEYIMDYDLDLFILAFIMVLDALLYCVRGIRVFCYGPNQGIAEVNPEVANESPQPRLKNSKYDYDSGEDLQQSRDRINPNQNRNYNNNPNPNARRRR